MLWALALWSAQAADMQIVVDGDVSHVKLTCDREVIEKDLSAVRPTGTQTVTLPVYPGRQCTIEVTKRLGQLEQIGEWRCTDSGCSQTAADSGPVMTAGPGEIAVFIAAEVPHTQLELTCPSGYRERVDISESKATFSGVPSGEGCTMLFKGGPPYKANDLSSGTAYRCHIVSNTPVCKPQ